IAGTNAGVSVPSPVSSRAWRRQANNWEVESPCRRAVSLTDCPQVRLSATIRALSSALQDRRRPEPVKTSIRRTGSVIVIVSVIILGLALNAPNIHRSPTPTAMWGPDSAYRLPVTISGGSDGIYNGPCPSDGAHTYVCEKEGRA